MKKQEKKKSKSYKPWYFTLISLIIFVLTILIKPAFLEPILITLGNILLRILPPLVIVFILLFVFNLFSDNRKLIKYFTQSKGIKTWLIAVVAGIISSGPIYVWYPLLKELQHKGVKNGIIATFLYNRAIKIPLLPMMILYFGLKFTIILTLVMIVFSIIQGILVDYIVKVES